VFPAAFSSLGGGFGRECAGSCDDRSAADWVREEIAFVKCHASQIDAAATAKPKTPRT
jgi:hypothetical protein